MLEIFNLGHIYINATYKYCENSPSSFSSSFQKDKDFRGFLMLIDDLEVFLESKFRVDPKRLQQCMVWLEKELYPQFNT